MANIFNFSHHFTGAIIQTLSTSKRLVKLNEAGLDQNPSLTFVLEKKFNLA